MKWTLMGVSRLIAEARVFRLPFAQRIQRFIIIIFPVCYSRNRGRLELQSDKGGPAAHGLLFVHRVQWCAALRQ